MIETTGIIIEMVRTINLGRIVGTGILSGRKRKNLRKRKRRKGMMTDIMMISLKRSTKNLIRTVAKEMKMQAVLTVRRRKRKGIEVRIETMRGRKRKRGRRTRMVTGIFLETGGNGMTRGG